MIKPIFSFICPKNHHEPLIDDHNTNHKFQTLDYWTHSDNTMILHKQHKLCDCIQKSSNLDFCNMDNPLVAKVAQTELMHCSWNIVSLLAALLLLAIHHTSGNVWPQVLGYYASLFQSTTQHISHNIFCHSANRLDEVYPLIFYQEELIKFVDVRGKSTLLAN